ncbi:MAG: methyltransferase domain-containing protein [Thermomicrobiales bacterium]
MTHLERSTTHPTGAAVDTSNFRKHTHANPIQRQLINRFHRRIMARIADLSPESFLDAGCGEGFVAEIMLRQFPSLPIVGFDFNPASVEAASAKNPTATFTTADIFDLPYENGTFDVVGCFEVLEHLPNPSAALAELARVAKQAVVLSVPHEPYFCYANLARGKNLNVRPRGSDPDHRNFWSRRAFGTFVDESLDVQWLGGSFPWTICVARRRDN